MKKIMKKKKAKKATKAKPLTFGESLAKSFGWITVKKY